MVRLTRIILCLVLATPFVAALFACQAVGADESSHQSASPLTLWYRQPADLWVEAIPLGNGRLGAMVFGGSERDRLQLNEDTLWGGGPYTPANPDALAALPEVRSLVFAEKFKEAQQLMDAKMMAKPLREMPYQLVGDLELTFVDHPAEIPDEKASDYLRRLDLDVLVRIGFGMFLTLCSPVKTKFMASTSRKHKGKTLCLVRTRRSHWTDYRTLCPRCMLNC